jgi:hypothetical protein
VSEHVLPPLQFALQEPAQVPVQVFPSRQEREQLPPAALQPVAADAVQSQVAPGWQVQLLPAQTQEGPGQAEELEESQAARARTAATARAEGRCRMRVSPSEAIECWTRPTSSWSLLSREGKFLAIIQGERMSYPAPHSKMSWT